jgi:hypothetical protein
MRKWTSRTTKAAVIAVLASASAVTIVSGTSTAIAPSQPASCGFTFGKQGSVGTAGTLQLGVDLNPAVPYQRCSTTVTVTAAITTTDGSLATGVHNDPATEMTAVSFVPSQRPPVVRFSWGSSCTDVAQEVNLVVSSGGQKASYPLGTSLSCQSRDVSYSTLESGIQGPSVNVIGLAATPTGAGYRLVDSQGLVTDEGDASLLGVEGDSSSPVVGIAAAATGDGYWLVASDGGVFTYGSPTFDGSLPAGPGGLGITPASPIVGIAADPATGGYWLVGADGGVFSFDAPYLGSVPSQHIHLNGPVVGMAVTPDGGGYWLASADGGVFSFGDAAFYGSAGSIQLAAPVDGIAADPATGGYWLVGADGGVFGFDAPYLGSVPGQHINLGEPIAGITPTADGRGYWLVGADGGVFTYGDAPFYGSAVSYYSG